MVEWYHLTSLNHQNHMADTWDLSWSYYHFCNHFPMTQTFLKQNRDFRSKHTDIKWMFMYMCTIIIYNLCKIKYQFWPGKNKFQNTGWQYTCQVIFLAISNIRKIKHLTANITHIYCLVSCQNWKYVNLNTAKLVWVCFSLDTEIMSGGILYVIKSTSTIYGHISSFVIPLFHL
jgi:hypothetical protein